MQFRWQREVTLLLNTPEPRSHLPCASGVFVTLPRHWLPCLLLLTSKCHFLGAPDSDRHSHPLRKPLDPERERRGFHQLRTQTGHFCEGLGRGKDVTGGVKSVAEPSS